MSTLPDTPTIRTALRGLIDETLPESRVRAAYAAAVWSTLLEPGDGTAGALIASYGIEEALERVVTDSAATTAGRAGIAQDELERARARWLPRAGAVAAALEAARRAGVVLLTPDDDAWPDRLADLGAHMPVCLWARGEPRLLTAARTLALVGARAATAYGTHVAAELAAEASDVGVAIVSGAAYGIDGAAHRGALRTGGSTIAVLAGGIDRPYPAGHDELIATIARTGLVVAEVPCGAAPTKWRFLGRNRVIAALADATVVVEAAQRSGALNTAHHAAALGRPLGAVPGPVTSAASAGCHRLLRDADAVCITRTGDALELLGVAEPASLPGGDGDRTDDRTRVLDALSGRRARSSAEVARLSGLSEADARGLLGFLELEGRVQRTDAGWVRCSTSAPAWLW